MTFLQHENTPVYFGILQLYCCHVISLSLPKSSPVWFGGHAKKPFSYLSPRLSLSRPLELFPHLRFSSLFQLLGRSSQQDEGVFLSAREPDNGMVKADGNPEVYLVDNFVIEAYASINEVPYATVSERRGNKAVDASHIDELHDRCRICLLRKSNGENMSMCNDCKRTFHTTCLVQLIREAPRSDWRCPQCTADYTHRRVACALAVRRLREVLTDVHTRPKLPPKLQLKHLGVRNANTIFGALNSYGHHIPPQLQAVPACPRRPRTLPPRIHPTTEIEERYKTPLRTRQRPSSPPIISVKRFKPRKRVKYLSARANDLQSITNRVGDTGVQRVLPAFQNNLRAVGRKRSLADHEASAHLEMSPQSEMSKPKAQMPIGRTPPLISSQVVHPS